MFNVTRTRMFSILSALILRFATKIPQSVGYEMFGGTLWIIYWILNWIVVIIDKKEHQKVSPHVARILTVFVSM